MQRAECLRSIDCRCVVCVDIFSLEGYPSCTNTDFAPSIKCFNNDEIETGTSPSNSVAIESEENVEELFLDVLFNEDESINNTCKVFDKMTQRKIEAGSFGNGYTTGNSECKSLDYMYLDKLFVELDDSKTDFCVPNPNIEFDELLKLDVVFVSFLFTEASSYTYEEHNDTAETIFDPGGTTLDVLEFIYLTFIDHCFFSVSSRSWLPSCYTKTLFDCWSHSRKQSNGIKIAANVSFFLFECCLYPTKACISSDAKAKKLLTENQIIEVRDVWITITSRVNELLDILLASFQPVLDITLGIGLLSCPNLRICWKIFSDLAAFECNLVIITLLEPGAMNVEYWEDLKSQLLVSPINDCSIIGILHLLATVAVIISSLNHQSLSSAVHYVLKACGSGDNRRVDLEGISTLLGGYLSNKGYAAMLWSQTQLNMVVVWGESIGKLILRVTTVLTATNIGVVLANEKLNHWNLEDLYEVVQIRTWDHDLQPSASVQFLEEEMSILQHELEGKTTDLTCYFAYQFEVASFGGQILLHYCHWHWRFCGCSVQPMVHEPNAVSARSLNKKRIETFAKYLFKWKDLGTCSATGKLTANNIGSIKVFGGNSGHCYVTSSIEEAKVLVSLPQGVSLINEEGAYSEDCTKKSLGHSIMLLPEIEPGGDLQSDLSWQSYVWGTVDIVFNGGTGSLVSYVQMGSLELLEVFQSPVVGTMQLSELIRTIAIYCRWVTLMRNIEELIAYKLCNMWLFYNFLGRLTDQPLLTVDNFSMHMDITPCLLIDMYSDVLSLIRRESA